MNEEKKASIGKWILIALAMMALLWWTHHHSNICVLCFARGLNPQKLLQNSLTWIGGLGAAAPIIFIVIYIFACVFFLPGAILTLGAGAIFGVVKGSIVVSVAATLGATAAFLVGRYIARGWVEKKIAGNEKFKTIDEAVEREGWKIVGLTRLSPAFPFTLINYAYGVTKVSLRDYFFASWVGMMPGTVMYVYIGSLAGDVATAGAGGESSGAAQWAIRIVGLLATIAVTVYVTKIAKLALEKKVS